MKSTKLDFEKIDDVRNDALRYRYGANRLLQDLKRIRKKSYIPLWWITSDATYGICKQLDYFDRDSTHLNIFYYLTRTWPEYSGNPCYPISTAESKTPMKQYRDTIFYWCPYTKYGKARRRLLDHLISCLEQFLE